MFLFIRLGCMLPCLFLAANYAALNFKTGRGGSSLQWVPSRCGPLTVVDDSPAGKGSPPMRPAGAVVKASNAGDRVDEEDDDDDVEEDVESSTDRWVS
jgi:hypothetical protein